MCPCRRRLAPGRCQTLLLVYILDATADALTVPPNIKPPPPPRRCPIVCIIKAHTANVHIHRVTVCVGVCVCVSDFSLWVFLYLVLDDENRNDMWCFAFQVV